MPLAFIILSYNSLREAARLGSRLAAALHGSTSLVVLVDNASPSRDGYEQWRACASENVSCLELADNVGYSRGNNAGIDLAIARGIDDVVVLNPDVTIDDTAEFLEGVRRHFQDDEFLCLGLPPRGITPYATPVTVASLLFPVVCRVRDRLLQRRRSDSDVPATFGVGRIHGCAFALRAKAFRRLGLFDEEVFLYGEEAIVSIVAGRAGMPIIQSTRVFVDHPGAAPGKVNWFANRCHYRTMVLTLRKYFRFPGWAARSLAWVPFGQQLGLQLASLGWRRLRAGGHHEEA